MARLFEPLTLKSIMTRNRIVISPMCQYSAKEGLANDWHFAHLSTFALGEPGLSSLKWHSSQTQSPRGLGMTTPSSIEISIS